MPTNWTPEMETELLWAIIVKTGAKVDSDTLSTHINSTFGTNTTSRACTEKLAGMRRKRETTLAALGAGNLAAAGPATPKKAAGTSSKASATKKTAIKVATPKKRGGEGGDNEEEEEKPAGRSTPARKGRKVMKIEEESEGEKDRIFEIDDV